MIPLKEKVFMLDRCWSGFSGFVPVFGLFVEAQVATLLHALLSQTIRSKPRKTLCGPLSLAVGPFLGLVRYDELVNKVLENS